jgi:hypothetical protein
LSGDCGRCGIPAHQAEKEITTLQEKGRKTVPFLCP